MSEEDCTFDSILTTIIESKITIEGFLESICGFLRRKTNFFLNQTQAERIITQSCQKQYLFLEKLHQEKETNGQNPKIKEDIFYEQKLKQDKNVSLEKDKENEKIKESEYQKEGCLIDSQLNPESNLAHQFTTNVSQITQTDDEIDQIPHPIGNGGKTDLYIWTQTKNDLQIFVPLESKIREKLIKVLFSLNHLKVTVEDKVIIDNFFPYNIKQEDSFWTIENGEIQDYQGNYLNIFIEKKNEYTLWWDCALTGHDKINIKKINLENPQLIPKYVDEIRSIVDWGYDFDYRLKFKPKSSEELKKEEMLKEFMKTHPEMDFSKCSFK